MKHLKILLLLILFPALMFAEDYEFVVENSTMVDVYFNIFNAIAAMLQNDSYISLLKLTFLLGGFFVFVGTVLAAWEGANAKSLSPYGKYLIGGMALLTLVFSNKATMSVTTNNIPSYCTLSPSITTGFMVELPSVLAYTFATSNLIGKELTALADSAFSIPSMNGSTSMKDSDGYLGALKQSIKLFTMDPNKVTMSQSGAFPENYDMSGALEKHYSKCIYEVANNKGVEGQKALTKFEASDDLELSINNFLGENFGDASIQVAGLALVTINGHTMTCAENYVNNLEPMFAKFKSEVACSEKYKNMNNGVFQLLTKQDDTTVSEMQGISIQAGLINSLENSKRISGIGISGANYATGKSKAEFNQSSMATGSYMAEMMPYIQMTMRAILYGFFPFVFVVMLLPGGFKVLTQYAQTMLWIELWGPTAAIINMFVSMQAQVKLSGYYTKEGLTLSNSVDMLSDVSTIAGYGSYLYASVPALTWLILKGSGTMLGNVTSGISAGFGANLASKAINQDAADLKAVNNHNKEREKAGLQAVSFGEAMHYESQIGGAQRAGKLNSTMHNGGLDAQTDAAQQIESTNLKQAKMNKILNHNSNEEVADVKSIDGAMNIESTKNKLEQTGLFKNGKADMEKIQSFGTTEGAKQTIDMLANSKNDNLLKELMPNSTIEDRNNFRSQVSSIKTTTSEQTENKTQEKLQQQINGEANKDGINNKSNIDSTKAEIDTKSTGNFQKAIGTKEAIVAQTYDAVEKATGTNEKSKHIDAIKSGEGAGKKAGANSEAISNSVNSVDYNSMVKSEQLKLTTDYLQGNEEVNQLGGGDVNIASKEKSTAGASNNVKQTVATNNNLEKNNQENINASETFKLMTETESNTKTMEKAVGSIDPSKASSIISNGNAVKAVVGAQVANEVENKEGLKNMTDAEVRSNRVKIQQELNKSASISDEAVSKSSKEDEDIRKTLQENKTYEKHMLSDINSGVETNYNARLNKLSGENISDNDKKTMAGLDLVKTMSEKNFYNGKISEDTYKATSKGFEEQKNKALKGLDKEKDKDKIANINDNFVQNLKDLDSNFMRIGAVKADEQGNITFTDTKKELNSLNKNSNEYNNKLRVIKGNFDGNNIKGTDVYGYDAKYTENTLTGELTSKSLKAEMGINATGSRLDMSYMASQALGSSYEKLMAVAVGTKAIEVGQKAVSTVKSIKSKGSKKDKDVEETGE